jgi:hypothetical protein
MSTREPTTNTVAVADKKEFEVWRTIELGMKKFNGRDPRYELYRRMDNQRYNQGYYISKEAEQMLPHIRIARTKIIAHLVRVKVRDFGFTIRPTLEIFYAEVFKDGLKICLNEVAVQLRLDFTDQGLSRREDVLIGMQPLVASDGSLNIFHLCRDDSPYRLYAKKCDPGQLLNLDDSFIFIQP